jgi:hypothetical protein
MGRTHWGPKRKIIKKKIIKKMMGCFEICVLFKKRSIGAVPKTET